MPPLFQSEVIPSRHPSQKPQLPLTSPPRTPKKIKKYTILISVFLLLLLFASQNISNFQKLALNCLDRSLSIPIKLKQAKFCSHLSGSSPIHRFIQDFDFAISSTQPLLQSLFSSGLFYQDSLSTFRFSLGRLSESASDLDGQLKLLQPPNSLNKKIFSLRQLTAQLLDISSDLPRLLAVNSQTSFLVLIQDSTELRSSGGLVDTLAHLTLSNTHLISSRFFSSSSLSATSSSPPLWQKLTRQSVWQIRDANFDPNFPVAATEISRLFTRSTSLPVDYVVALNLQTLKNLLDFTGPVSLSEVDIPLTSQNL
ncbi:DUF4012 domain-containing protein, partial [Candidatus Amesbacteria bacterium]|nr:DUF4012 domain-containing protein [Candidatus Amesbacteria bacterium]